MVVGDILKSTATRYPNKTGVVFGDRRYTWGQVNARVNSMARALLEMGLKKGERVAILSKNCNEFFEFYFAVAKAGLIGVPLNARLKPQELLFLLRDSGARTLIVHEDFADTIEPMKPELAMVNHYIGIGTHHPFPHDFEMLISDHVSDEPETEVNEEDIFTIAYTSGTVGRPKGVIVSHGNSVAGASTMALEMRLLPHSNYLSFTALFWGAAMGARFHAVLRGCTYVLMGFEPEAVLRTIEKERISGFTCGPTMHRMLLEHPDIEKYDLSSLRSVWFTMSAVPDDLWAKAKKYYGIQCSPCWGMTETSNQGTVLQPEEVDMEGPLSERLRSIGKPMIGCEVKVVDASGREIPHNERETGELLFRGKGATRGYWNLPDETAETIQNGWLYSGDIATVDEDGYLYVVDRKKDLVKSGGVLVSSVEVERVIEGHPAVQKAAVISVPDRKWGETIKAVVEIKPGCAVTEDELIGLCKSNLASYKKPTSVDFVDALPLTGSSKVSKRELRETYWKEYESRVH